MNRIQRGKQFGSYGRQGHGERRGYSARGLVSVSGNDCRRILAAGLGFGLLIAGPLAGVDLRVGTGTGCTYPTIAAAVAAAVANGTTNDKLLIRTGTSHTISAPITLNLNVAGTVEIIGGYANCTDALPTLANSGLSAPSSAAFTVQNPGAGSRTFTLRNVDLFAGAGAGRLLDVSGRVLVNIDRTLLSNGSATDGANLRMTGPNVVLLLLNGARIYTGDATGNGGGLHCSGGGSVGLIDGAIDNNHAGGSGGGAYLDGCYLDVYSGGGAVACPSADNRGVTCNTAGAGPGTGSGGGVYATNGSVVQFLGSSSGPASLTQNSADSGGGLYLTGAASEAEFRDAEIVDNLGGAGGGGVAADNGAQLRILGYLANCSHPSGCSRVVDNTTASIVGETSPGGGVWVSGGADANIRRTTFRGNGVPVVDEGSALAVEGAGSTAIFEGNVVYGQVNHPIYVASGGNLTAAFVTAWGNGSGATFTGVSSSISVYSSLTLDSQTFLSSFVTLAGDCIITRSLVGFPEPPDPLGSFEVVASEAVVLVSPATGSPRLRSDSPAIDYCDTFHYTPIDNDIDGEVRGFDIAAIPNSPYGPYDLGADEWKPLFLGDFEPGSCAQWSSNTGGC